MDDLKNAKAEIIIRTMPSGRAEVIIPFKDKKLCKNLLDTAYKALEDYHKPRIIPSPNAIINFARRR